MPGLMGDHAIDIVGTPAIVLVMHHKTRPAKARVRKMMQAILYKKMRYAQSVPSRVRRSRVY